MEYFIQIKKDVNNDFVVKVGDSLYVIPTKKGLITLLNKIL